MTEERVVKIKNIKSDILMAILDLIVECTGVNVEIYKPRLSFTYHVRFKGENINRAINMLARFCAKSGCKIS